MGLSSSQGAVERLKALRGKEDRERERWREEEDLRQQGAEGGGNVEEIRQMGWVWRGVGGWPLKYTEEWTIHKHLTCL